MYRKKAVFTGLKYIIPRKISSLNERIFFKTKPKVIELSLAHFAVKTFHSMNNVPSSIPLQCTELIQRYCVVNHIIVSFALYRDILM